MKRYDHPNSKLANKRGHAGVQLPDGVDVPRAIDELYGRVGERFRVDWEPWSPAEPVIYTAELPDGVTEADVESALNGMKSDGIL